MTGPNVAERTTTQIGKNLSLSTLLRQSGVADGDGGSVGKPRLYVPATQYKNVTHRQLHQPQHSARPRRQQPCQPQGTDKNKNCAETARQTQLHKQKHKTNSSLSNLRVRHMLPVGGFGINQKDRGVLAIISVVEFLSHRSPSPPTGIALILFHVFAL